MRASFAPYSLSRAMVWGPLRSGFGRTFLSVIAIALGVALGFSIDAMNRAATAEMVQASRNLFGQADLIVQGPSQGFDENLYPAITHIKGVQIASPVVQVDLRLPNRRDSITLIGMDLLRVATMQPALPTAHDTDRDTHTRDKLAIFDPALLMLSAQAANALHANVDDVVTLQLGTRPLEFKVAAILPSAVYAQNVGILDIGAAQWRLDRLAVLTRIDIRLASGADPVDVIREIENVLPPGIKVTTAVDESQQSLQLSRAFTINLTALALVALFTGAFLVYATQSLAVTRRRREFALLHALGVTQRQQIAGVVFVGALLGVVGAALGIVLGAMLSKLGIEVFLGNLNVGMTPHLQFSPLMTTGFFLLGVLVSIAGSVAPAITAARIPTAQALKSGDADTDNEKSKGISMAALIGLALWLIAPLVLLIGPIHELPLPGYLSIALILLGAVLLIPSFTRRIIRWLPPHRNAVYQTARAQISGTANKATVSVATILVSVSLMVAMGIMVTSLRGSFADSLERMLPADLYISSGNQNSSSIDAQTFAIIGKIDGVARIEISRVVEIIMNANRAPATLIARPIDELSARDTIFLESEAKHPIAANTTAVWVSVAMADHLQLHADDEFQLPIANRLVRASVRGIWRDNGRSNDAVMMDIEQYRKLSGDERVSSLALWLRKDATPEEVMQAIRAQLPAGAALDPGIPKEQRAARLAGFDRVFAVTYLLEAVAVLIGLFGISVSASAQALARRAEFGVLRHLGFSRAQIGRLLAIEGFGLGTLGVIAGFIIGSVISMILIFVVGRQSFHWTMDLHVPTAALLILALVIPAAASLTALWSGRAAMNEDVVSAVKEDW